VWERFHVQRASQWYGFCSKGKETQSYYKMCNSNFKPYNWLTNLLRITVFLNL
jgi:hypothetical protein